MRDWEAYERVAGLALQANQEEALHVEVDLADLDAVLAIIESEFGTG